MGPLPLLGHREGRAGNREPRETTYIIRDTRSPEGGPERAPEVPGREQEVGAAVSWDQVLQSWEMPVCSSPPNSGFGVITLVF